MKNYYDILEIHPEAGQEVIEASYKALYKRFDPENFSDDQEKLQAKIMRNQLNEAYRVLCNPKRREKYDKLYKEKGGHIEIKRFSEESIILLVAITIILIIVARYIADTFFPQFAKLTNIIAASPVLQTFLVLILIGIAIHYFWKSFKGSK